MNPQQLLNERKRIGIKAMHHLRDCKKCQGVVSVSKKRNEETMKLMCSEMQRLHAWDKQVARELTGKRL